jgi:hypothetical protein
MDGWMANKQIKKKRKKSIGGRAAISPTGRFVYTAKKGQFAYYIKIGRFAY